MDTILDWIATLLLWFVYLMLLIMGAAVTYKTIVSKRIISWLLTFVLAFCYTVIIGRYWEYGYTLISISVFFVLVKVYFVLYPIDKKEN